MQRMKLSRQALTNRSRSLSKKVVVAEEDDDLRSALIDELSWAGFDVVEVEDGLELCDYLKFAQSPRRPLAWPVVIISDVELSGCGGIEVCEWVHGLDMPIPFILLTPVTNPRLRVAAERAGAAYVFEKPFKVEEVREAVAFLAGLQTRYVHLSHPVPSGR